MYSRAALFLRRPFRIRVIIMEIKTIAAHLSACFVEKRSRFLADIAPADDEGAAQRFISEIRAKNSDARHHAYAFILADGIRKSSDDGEPQGTAGLPMMDILKKRGLQNIAAVVSRYFGGALLGAHGLFRAYSSAVALALGNAEIITLRGCRLYRINAAYPHLKNIQGMILAYEGHAEEYTYSENVTFKAVVPCEKCYEFLNAVESLPLIEKPVFIGETYCEKIDRGLI